MNTFGERFRFTSFGESHGPAIGGVIDGLPSGLHIDEEAIRVELSRRSHPVVRLEDGRIYPLPGGSSRAADEPDQVEWLSGQVDGVTIGTPLAFLIKNTHARASDYDAYRDVFRPGHADYTYFVKYGIRDYRGGGRASARETAARVVAGSIAKQLLTQRGITINAELTQIGKTTDPARFADEIQHAQADGDSIGGIISCRISGVEAGVGEPIFDKLQARLAYAMLSINACKGFEYGSGFAGVVKRGSEINAFSGGMLGGITDGTDIIFSCVFKPTPSIAIPQMAKDIEGNLRQISIHGRHDACVAARAVPVVEAMAAITLVDYLL